MTVFVTNCQTLYAGYYLFFFLRTSENKNPLYVTIYKNENGFWKCDLGSEASSEDLRGMTQVPTFEEQRMKTIHEFLLVILGSEENAKLARQIHNYMQDKTITAESICDQLLSVTNGKISAEQMSDLRRRWRDDYSDIYPLSDDAEFIQILV